MAIIVLRMWFFFFATFLYTAMQVTIRPGDNKKGDMELQ